jgi:ATP-dependent exoDNAse (exonuclease V) alpha subunit
MTMARFREGVEKLGYETGPVLKHGNFEAAGIARNVVMAFSSRREQILEQAARMANSGPKVMDAATLMTRAAKPVIADREGLVRDWQVAAREVGIDLPGMIGKANARAASDIGRVGPVVDAVRTISERGREWMAAFALMLGYKPNLPDADPLLPANLARQDRDVIAAAQAVASAVRHLSEREAAFPVTDLYKAALDFGLPTTMPPIEARVAHLRRDGLLLPGSGAGQSPGPTNSSGLVTTLDALGTEQRLIAHVDEGRGQVVAIVLPEAAAERLQAHAKANSGFRLNHGQEAAGRLLLGSTNRIIAIQGVAGAGKSTLLRPAAAIMHEDGRKVLGLAVQNTLVQLLERETGIPSMTVARFLRSHRDLLSERPDPDRLEAARGEYRSSVVLLDEASMVGNADQEKLMRLANLLELGRFAAIGDQKQLGAVDAGKPFAVMQASGVETAIMNRNVRARDPVLMRAQSAAQGGHVFEALAFLKPHTIEVKNDAAVTAATTWLALSPAERERTAIYASGRKLRGEVNEAVQAGLKTNGELGKPELIVETLQRVSTTREQLRYSDIYEPGQIVEFDREQRAQKLGPGRYRIESVDHRKGVVTLRDGGGRARLLVPSRLKPRDGRDPLQIFEEKRLTLHPGDRIRWTDSDHRRGLFNADQARVLEIGKQGVKVRTSTNIEQTLKRGDPMLKRLDLAYALNAHMAQGLTSDRGIAVMDSREAKLANQQTFLVTITRLRDGLTLIVDNADKLERAIERNTGAKTSALETLGRLGNAAAQGLAKGQVAEIPKVRTSETATVRATEADKWRPEEPGKVRAAEPGKAAEPPQLERTRSKLFDFGL